MITKPSAPIALWCLITLLLLPARQGFSASVARDGWISLFDGHSLQGWIQRGGKAEYDVEDGAIVGHTAPQTPNSFLCTDRDYGDFVLELEFKVDPKMNAGIQFRSESRPDYHNGQVHGYQFEIDPSPRAWTGGIYDEGRRGWLNNLAGNESAQKAFRQNEWNRVRVQAIGPSLKTWINDVPAADLVDDKTLSGFIALQVHGVGKRQEAMEIRWRNIRLKDLSPEKAVRLFDGESLDGWTTASGTPVRAGWTAADGVLYRKGAGGDIFTADEFGDFVLDFDWKISPGGNSGVKYRVTKYGGALLGPEYQILDDEQHPDGRLREGRREAAALYDLYRCNDDKHLQAVESWNHSRIIARGSRVEHWLNGQRVLAYDTSGEDWRTQVAGSKFSKIDHFAQNPRGRFMLQDHGDEVWYRNILVRSLD